MDKEIPMIDDEHVNAVKAVFEQVSKLKKGESKEIECPKSNKKLFISKDKHNGHFFIRCESKNCIFLIQ